VPSNKLITKVLAVHQSPMNHLRWLLCPQCGHEIWIMSKRSPRCKTIKCPQKTHRPEASHDG
jgi:DNA-directed RNA polymerase subunit RPC12/RpoP